MRMQKMLAKKIRYRWILAEELLLLQLAEVKVIKDILNSSDSQEEKLIYINKDLERGRAEDFLMWGEDKVKSIKSLSNHYKEAKNFIDNANKEGFDRLITGREVKREQNNIVMYIEETLKDLKGKQVNDLSKVIKRFYRGVTFDKMNLEITSNKENLAHCDFESWIIASSRFYCNGKKIIMLPEIELDR